MRIPPLLLLAVLVLAATPCAAPAPASASGNDLPPHVVADPTAEEVVGSNLMEGERFWPDQVALLAPWAPPGRERAIDSRFPGVLVRVLDGRSARIDFGRDGVHTVPIAKTDLLNRANAIRRGDAEKPAANFVFMIGPRLVSSSGPTPRSMPFVEAMRYDRFVLVFADPDSEGLEGIATSLRPIGLPENALVVFFPLARKTNGDVYDRLRALDWPVAFVFDHLAEPYARVLLGELPSEPRVMLVTGEGRSLLDAGWTPRLAERIGALLAPSQVSDAR